jgi:hypothetical protein
LVTQFFDFFTTNLEHTMKLPANITSIELHRDSGLLAVVCDDLIIRVLDVETRRIVRELSGPRRPILDMVSCPFLSISYLTYVDPELDPSYEDLFTGFAMVDHELDGFGRTDVRRTHWSIGRCLQNDEYRHWRDILADW